MLIHISRLSVLLLKEWVYCIAEGTNYFTSLGIPYFISFFLGLIVSPLLLVFTIIVVILKFISFPFLYLYINNKKIKSSRKKKIDRNMKKAGFTKPKKTKRT